MMNITIILFVQNAKKVLYLEYCDVNDIKQAAFEQLNSKVEKHYLYFEGML
jgi:hypothetical protein